MPTRLDCALVQDEYPVVVEDGVEAVGDGEQRLPLKLPEERLLHQRVGLLVHRGRRLVQQDQLIFGDELGHIIYRGCCFQKDLTQEYEDDMK